MKATQLFLTIGLITMSVINLNAQSIHIPSGIKPSGDFGNIWSQELYSDTLVTSQIIWVRKTVELHKHEHHSEHVYVISGSGEMTLGGEHVSIVEGDFIIIPKNTQHSVEVSSAEPLKIISVMSPKFTGKDRVNIE